MKAPVSGLFFVLYIGLLRIQLTSIGLDWQGK